MSTADEILMNMQEGERQLEGVRHQMEIGMIDSFRFITSPELPEVKRRGKRAFKSKMWMDEWRWISMFKPVPAHAPRYTGRRATSARKRKALYHSLARRVPDPVAFVTFGY